MNQPQNNYSCPYKGLQPFTTEDRDYFFGREDEIEIATSNLRVAPLTVLYGASGVGKTSVLMAGVVSRLQREKEAAAIFFRDWQNVDFVSALRKETLDAIKKVTGNEIEIPEKDSFVDFLTECTKAFPGPLLFILDQFEEYFLYHGPTNNQTGSSQTKLDFDVELARAINRRDLRANFLLSLREDGLSKLDRLQTRIPNLLGNLVRLDHLNADSARAAIRKPLGVYNKISGEAPVKIEKELVEKLLSQVQTGHVMLSDSAAGDAQIPHDTGRIETSFLQLVLERLWLTEAARWRTEPKAEAHWLRAQTLDDLKGAAHIVRTHLDDVMASLEDLAREQQVSLSAQEAFPLIAEVFRFLVTSSGTKIAHTSDDLASFAELEDSKRNLLNDVLNLLALPNVRILRKVDPPPGSTGERFEIYHDVLGPAIRDWRIRFATEQAEAHAKAEADKILTQQRYEAEQKALAARREQERILAKQREEAEQKAMAAQLAQATALADAERKRAAAEGQRAELELTRAKEQAKAARRFRLAAVGLAVLLLFAVGTSVFAFFQRNLATQKASEADKARKDAEAKANEARLARVDAEAQANEARLARADAEAQAKEARLAKEEAIAKAEEARVARGEAEKERLRAESERAKAVAAKAEADAARDTQIAYRTALDLSRRETTWPKALEKLQALLKQFRESKDQDATKDVLLTIGDINAALSNDSLAKQNYDEALTFASDDSARAGTQSRIGDTYRELPVTLYRPRSKVVEYREKAKNYYRSTLELYEKIGDKRNQALVLALLGMARLELVIDRPSPTVDATATSLPEPGITNELEEAIRNFEGAEKIFRDLKEDKSQGMQFWNAGFAAQQLATADGWKRAEDYYKQAIQKYEKIGDRKSQIALHSNIVSLTYQTQDFDKRLTSLISIAKLHREIGDLAGENQAVVTLGEAYSIQLESADPTKNQGLAQRAPEILEILRGSAASLKAGNDPNAAFVFQSIARISIQIEDFPAARSAYQEALDQFVRTRTRDFRAQLYVLQKLTQLAIDVRDKQSGKLHLEKTRQLMTQLPKDEKRVNALLHFGERALDLEELELAANAYDEAIALAREGPTQNSAGVFSKAEALLAAGNDYISHSLMDKALPYLRKAIELFGKQKEPVWEAEALTSIAAIYRDKEDYAKAIEYYEQSLRLYHLGNLPKGEAFALRAISEAYLALGNQKKADEYRQRADAIVTRPEAPPSPSPSPG